MKEKDIIGNERNKKFAGDLKDLLICYLESAKQDDISVALEKLRVFTDKFMAFCTKYRPTGPSDSKEEKKTPWVSVITEKKESPWISVDDIDFPNADETVLVKNENFPHTPPEVAYYSHREDKSFLALQSICSIPLKVTHWMRIPE